MKQPLRIREIEKFVQRGRVFRYAVSPWVFPHNVLDLFDVVFEPGENRMVPQ